MQSGIESATKTQKAYWALRRAIVTGELPEMTALDDGNLGARFGVGRTPLREALKRLATEGFVIWSPHRTPYVRATSAQDLAQLYEARQIFEVPATQLSAERATSDELDELGLICDRLDSVVTEGELYDVAEQDYAFHLGVAKASHNRFLIEAVGHLNCGSLRLWYHSYVQIGTDKINDDHRRALTAIQNRDPVAAAAAARSHIEFSNERQVRLYGLSPSFGPSTEGIAIPAQNQQHKGKA